MALPPDVFGYAATALTFVQLPPQVWRTVRTRDVAGISPMFWSLLLVAGAAWVIYAVREGLAPTLVVNLLVIACCVAMLRSLVAERAPGSSAAFHVVTVGLPVVAALGLLLPPAAVGLAASGVTVAVFWPQVLTALRERDLSGLSLPMWVLSAVIAALWTVFGVLEGNPMLWVPPAHGTVLSLVVLARILLTRRADVAPAREPVAA